MNILDLLDQKINSYHITNKTYPSKIIMSKETKDKIFEALKSEPDLTNCWAETRDNYKGIEIGIKAGTFIKLI